MKFATFAVLAVAAALFGALAGTASACDYNAQAVVVKQQIVTPVVVQTVVAQPVYSAAIVVPTVQSFVVAQPVFATQAVVVQKQVVVRERFVQPQAVTGGNVQRGLANVNLGGGRGGGNQQRGLLNLNLFGG